MAYKQRRPIIVSEGGTGNTTLTVHSVLLGNSTSAVTQLANGTTGQILTAVTGLDPAWTAPAASSISITGNTGGALTGNAFTFTGGTTGLSFGGSGTTETLTFAGITANGGTVSLATDATTSTINVGTGAGVKTSTFGSVNSTSATTIQSGSGALAVTSTNGTLTINSGTGVLGISTDASATTVNVATGGAVKTAVFGSTNSTSGTGIQSGSTGIGINSTNGPITINSGTGIIGVSTDAINTTLNIGAGGAVKTVTLGSTNTTSGTTVQAGSNGITLTGAVTSANAITITAGALTTTAGDMINTAGNITLGATTSSTQGTLKIGGNRFLHAYGAVADNNTFLGSLAGNYTLTSATATNNTGIGKSALIALTLGTQNVALGVQAGLGLTTGVNNQLIGVNCAYQLTTGSYNQLLGNLAGSAYTGAESSNILIGNNVTGTVGESNVMRIGTGTGTAAGNLNATFISGIFGKTVGVSGIPVVVDNANQLGTVVSSIRFKENVTEIKYSKVLELNPVNFIYKDDKNKNINLGLIAEEVNEIMPELVVKDEEGIPFTVKYHELPVLLLYEIKKLRKEIDDMKKLNSI